MNSRIVKYRNSFIKMQFLFLCILTISIFYYNLYADLLLLWISSIWNIVSYIWIFIKELKYSKEFNPFQLLILVEIQFCGVNGLSLHSTLLNDNVLFGAQIVDGVINWGVWGLSLEHWVLFTVFYYFEKNYHNDSFSLYSQIVSSNINYEKWAINFYKFVWVLRLVGFVVPLASISSVLVNITNYGYLVTLYLIVFMMIKYPRIKRYSNLHWKIAILEIALVMTHGMKEEIIKALVPYCIYYFIMYKQGLIKINLNLIIKFSLIGIFVIGFVFPYISVFRTLANTKGVKWEDITFQESINEYFKYLNKEGPYKYDGEERGAGYLASRAGSIGCNAFAINYCYENGPVIPIFFYNLTSPIPRIFWPSKPKVVLGGMYYNLSHGETDWLNPNSVEERSASFSIGFVGSCIFSLGFLGGIMWMFVICCFIWYVWHICRMYMHKNIVSIWLFISLISLLYKDFEGLQDSGIIFIVTSSVFILIIKYMERDKKIGIDYDKIPKWVHEKKVKK